MAKAGIPVLVKHCALAIYNSGTMKGNVYEQASSALNIARHRLVEYGFLKKGSEQGESTSIKLTSKGFKSESKHRREGGVGHRKTRDWDKLYALIAEAEEGQDEGAMSTAVGLPGAKKKPGQKDRKKQTQVRHAKVAKRRTRRAGVPRAKRAKRG